MNMYDSFGWDEAADKRAAFGKPVRDGIISLHYEIYEKDGEFFWVVPQLHDWSYVGAPTWEDAEKVVRIMYGPKLGG